jgi:hypothetical protein
MQDTVVGEVAKAAPSVSMAGAVIAGVELNTVLIVLTIVYTSLQLFILVRDKLWRNKDQHAKN